MKKHVLFPAWVAVMAMLVISGCSHTSYLASTGDSEVSIGTEEEDSEVADQKKGGSAEVGEADGDSAKVQAEETIFVQVAGAVKKPGVYELSTEARVYEAVDAAGGLTGDAEESNLNLASRVADGQKLTIFTKSEWETLVQEAGENGALAADGTLGGNGIAGANSAASDLVNLNTADAGTLMTLSGIGESKAAAIITYREAHGGFVKPEELMQVDGIGTGTYEKIKDRITV